MESGRFDELIPPWLFMARSWPLRIALAVGLPILGALPLLIGHGEHHIAVGPLLVTSLVIVAALAGWVAAGIAAVEIVVLYWREVVLPVGSFRLPAAWSVADLVSMTVLVTAIAALTRRLETTVQDVRALDVERQEVTAMSAALAGGRDRREVASRALAALTLPTRPTEAIIALVDGGRLRVLAASGGGVAKVDALERTDLGQSRWLSDVLRGNPAFIDDRAAFERDFPDAQVLKLDPGRSWAVLPFRSSDTIGLLSVHFDEPQRLSRLRAYFALVTEMLATSLERAAAEEQQAAQLDELGRAFAERDRIARTLSTTLLPPQLPAIEGVESDGWLVPASADDVAGDFYDLFSTDGDDWVAALGDVCGKGAEAAAVTSLARYATRAAALTSNDALAVVEIADVALREDSSDLFCTMAVVRFEAATSEVEVTLAGHPQPRLLSGDQLRRIGSYGTPLGLAWPDFDVARYPFNAGDVLVLFSDGLVDRAVEFDEDALDEAILRCAGSSAEAVADHLRSVAADLPSHHPDDIAVLVIRRTA